MNDSPSLYLLPVPIGADVQAEIPADVINQTIQLRYFVVEKIRTARRYLRRIDPTFPIDDSQFLEMGKRSDKASYRSFLQAAFDGKHDVGVMSEAGCPAVADPGVDIVAQAYEVGFEIKPMVGPSSILLALMASGMDGQRFAFNGYLPVNAKDRNQAIRRFEKQSAQSRQTQLFIETPYRNNQLLEALLQQLGEQTQLCVVVSLLTPDQRVYRNSVGQWRKQKQPDLHKLPAIFLLLA